VLCHDLGDGDGRARFRKGQRLTATDAPALLALEWSELHVIHPDANDVHESDAGARIAAAAAGDGVEVGALSGGHWPLTAQRRGVLGVTVEALDRVNRLEGLCVYTLYDGQIVDSGETVARAKITPFVLAESLLAEGERAARDAGGLVQVRPFLPMRIGAVVQETLGQPAMHKFRDVLGEKVRWFGSTLLDPLFLSASAAAIAGGIETARSAGAQVIVLAGTKAMDPLDSTFLALRQLGIPLERYGVPAHPGSLFWMARDAGGDTAIVGMPSCGLFSQATVFDLVLPRLLTGERVGRDALARLGHGGLLTRELAFRFPRYRATAPRGELAVEE
jgi:hypothetical protein